MSMLQLIWESKYLGIALLIELEKAERIQDNNLRIVRTTRLKAAIMHNENRRKRRFAKYDQS